MSFRRYRYRGVILCVISFLIFFGLFQREVKTPLEAASSISIPAAVTGDNVYVRMKAGRTAAKVIYKETDLKLSRKNAVTVRGEAVIDGEKWYKLSVKVDGKTITGYMLSDYIALNLKTSVPAKIVNTSPQYVSTKAGKKTYLTVKKTKVTLAKGKAVKILKETTVAKKKWFYVSFTYSKKTYKGYVPANSVAFKPNNTKVIATPVASEKPTESASPSPEVQASATPKPSASPKASPTPKPSQEGVKGKKGVVTASALNVRTGAGTTYGILMHNGSKVQLSYGTEVTILGSKMNGETEWYQVEFVFKGNSLQGYVSGAYILVGGTPVPSPSVTPVVSQSPAPSNTPQAALTSKEFEAMLTNEGFPESYKADLRELHNRYPLWSFKVYPVNYDWDTAVEKESVVGKNLITKSKASGWKSYESGAYNWATDSFVPFDGSTWVTASKAAISYYMDPRNFLTTDGIFQFEYLAYTPEYQNVAGVESILKNTVLSNTSYLFTNDQGEQQSITYGETFLDAAVYSLVNPFHLATRVKQEVVTSKGLSSSATGKFSGYEGYYNFYNIGATHSTAANGAIINGLKYAKNGTGLSEAMKSLFLIPWNSPYRAIVGGAKFIGNNYISRGQNTVYLQKFNMSSYSTFKHQYMANVEAAKAEAQKTYAAYQSLTDIPVVFYIPVYRNMPDTKAPVPGYVKSPNNWLKTLSVSGGSMTPTFNVNNSESTTYTVIVDSTTTSVKINATSVSSLASVNGTGTFDLKEGNNTFTIKVTAENGDIRTYIVYVIRQ